MKLISETLHDVVVTLIATGIIAIMQLIIRKLYKNKYKFLLGEWHGYYLSAKEDFLLEQKITVSLNWLNKLFIKIEENTVANYKLNGKLEILDERLYSFIKGFEHEERAYIVMILPFNKKGTVPSMNGVFAGITQEKFPVAHLIHWSRSPKSLEQVKEELKLDATHIIIKKDTKENWLRKDVEESKKDKLEH